MLAKFFDDFAIAGRGLLLATRKKSFWLPFFLTFFIFGIVINLLSSGFVSFQLIGGCISSGDIGGALKIIYGAFLAIFGIGRAFSDFIFNFILILLQSILISLVVFIAKHNRREKRPKKEIGISAVRGGSIVGDHEVIFAGPDEVIEIKHTAYSRSIFGNGAVQAAKFLAVCEPGMYDMSDVIG